MIQSPSESLASDAVQLYEAGPRYYSPIQYFNSLNEIYIVRPSPIQIRY